MKSDIDPKQLKALMNNSFQLFKLSPSDDNIDKLIGFLQHYKQQETPQTVTLLTER